MSEVKRENQPNFPYDDISEINAGLFPGIVSNKEQFDLYHSAAAKARLRPYWSSLLALHATAVRNMPNLESKSHANLLSGMKLYNAMGYLATPARCHTSVSAGTLLSLGPLFEDDLNRRFEETMSIQKTFTAEMPRATQLIGKCAAHLFGENTDFVIAGAALARQFEIEARTRR